MVALDIESLRQRSEERKSAKLEPKDGDTIVVWFSHGAASAIAWQETHRVD